MHRRRNRKALTGAVLATVVLIAGGAVGVVLMLKGHAATASVSAPVVSPSTSHPTVSPVPNTATSLLPPRPAVPSVIKTVTAMPTAPSSTSAADFAAIYKRQQSGVVPIETIGCSDGGVGTGFLLSPTLVATVDHVTTQAAVVSLIAGDQHTTGTVIGSDPARDLALVRADQPLTGYQFHFSTAAPNVGDSVAAIGFPIGGPITLTHGDVSGLDRTITVEGASRTGMVETDTPLNPGNSGGPLIATDGSVVALVDAQVTDANGIGYAVPAGEASAADRQWAAAPVAQPPASCQSPVGPAEEPRVSISTPPNVAVSQDQLTGIVAAFDQYFGGINSGDYASAYSVLAPNRQSASGEGGFAKGVATSYDSNIAILDAQPVDAHTVTVDLAFNSVQTAANGPGGDTCDDWTLVYRLVQQSDGTWRMDGAKPYKGSTHTSC